MNGKQTFKQMAYTFMKYYESKIENELNKNDLNLSHWKLYQLYRKAYIEMNDEIYKGAKNEDILQEEL
ncbi:hypothetical protein J7J62_03970 [bacterium]|nr:hypothetical protein [bacterium]